jgi:hypothetical protein
MSCRNFLHVEETMVKSSVQIWTAAPVLPFIFLNQIAHEKFTES